MPIAREILSMFELGRKASQVILVDFLDLWIVKWWLFLLIICLLILKYLVTAKTVFVNPQPLIKEYIDSKTEIPNPISLYLFAPSRASLFCRFTHGIIWLHKSNGCRCSFIH